MLKKQIFVWFLGTLAMLVAGENAAASTRIYKFGAWIVKLRPDSFSHSDYCNLSGNGMSYQPGLVSFNFKPRVDASEAWYSVNGGEAMDSRQFQKRVADRLVFPEPGPIDNPSGGHVIFPEEVLSDASYIDIRPNQSAHIKRFKVGGFGAALAFITDHKCKLQTP